MEEEMFYGSKPAGTKRFAGNTPTKTPSKLRKVVWDCMNGYWLPLLKQTLMSTVDNHFWHVVNQYLTNLELCLCQFARCVHSTLDLRVTDRSCFRVCSGFLCDWYYADGLSSSFFIAMNWFLPGLWLTFNSVESLITYNILHNTECVFLIWCKKWYFV